MPTFHKYGFHVNRSGEDVFQAIRRIKPQVIKTLEHDVGFWKRVREIHPDVFLIGRQYVPNNEQDQFANDPTGIGRAFAERILGLEANNAEFQGRPLFDAWESYNEVMPESVDDDRKRKYDEFQVAFAERLRSGGFEPVAMNFATGNFLGSDFLQFFRGTLETYRYLGFHEYDWPDMWRLHKQNIEEKDEGGMWLTLRYRRIMNEVRKVFGDRHTVLITECGMTQGVVGGEDVGPWHESHPIPEERYWRSLLWYNNELMKDDYVMGACLFVVGAVVPWHSFEHLGGIMDRLERLQREGPDQPIPQPVPVAASEETVGAPGGEEAETEPESGPAEEPEETDESAPGPAPITAELQEALLSQASAAQSIHFNPQAAIQQRIFADGFVPNSPEFNVEVDGQRYIGQQAEHLQSGEVRVYYVQVGDWANVRFIPRGVNRGVRQA